MTKKLLSLIGFLSLSGCSTYQESFDCPAGVGVGCKSVSEVNQMVDKGQLGTNGNPEHLRVWVAPYRDTSGNLHSDSVVFMKVKDN